MQKTNTLPMTVRRSIELLGIVALLAIIYLGSSIIMPIFLALLLTILLLPVYRFLKRKKLPNVFAVLISLLALLIVLAIIIWFFSYQLGTLFADFPTIKKNIMIHLKNLSSWIANEIHFSAAQQIEFINMQSEKALNFAAVAISNTANSLTGFLLYATLVPLYIFLILQYKNLLLHFLFLWFKPAQQQSVKIALRETETIVKSYLGGLLIQITYMIALVGGTLWIIGIEHALLIGIIFAFLNLIPYVGALLGIIIGILLTLASSQDLQPIISVIIVIAAAQFLDNNILMPRIVGSKVRINALVTICGVIVGGALGGILGMFLSLPVMAILRVIFQRTESLYQWSVLLGDEVPKNSPMHEQAPVNPELVDNAEVSTKS